MRNPPSSGGILRRALPPTPGASPALDDSVEQASRPTMSLPDDPHDDPRQDRQPENDKEILPGDAGPPKSGSAVAAVDLVHRMPPTEKLEVTRAPIADLFADAEERGIIL